MNHRPACPQCVIVRIAASATMVEKGIRFRRRRTGRGLSHILVFRQVQSLFHRFWVNSTGSCPFNQSRSLMNTRLLKKSIHDPAGGHQRSKNPFQSQSREVT
jgi:hypothetical protein